MKTKSDYIKQMIDSEEEAGYHLDSEYRFEHILNFHIREKFQFEFANDTNLLKIRYLIIEIFRCFYPCISEEELNKINVRFDETLTQLKLDLGLLDRYLSDMWSRSIIRQEKLEQLGI